MDGFAIWLGLLFVWHGVFLAGGVMLFSKTPLRRHQGLGLVCVFGNSLLLLVLYGIVQMAGWTVRLDLGLFTLISLAPGAVLFWKIAPRTKT